MSHKAALPRICIALGLPSIEKLNSYAKQEAEAGETFLEFRLDYLPQPMQGVRLIKDFLSRYPQCTILATCRRHQNHGHFNGSIEEQLSILHAAIDSGARAVDLEIESAESVQPKLETIRGRAWLVVSYHNFGGTPSLDAVMRRMNKVPADAYKLVSTARKPTDNVKVLSLFRSSPRSPLILLAMGETGFPTRVLSTAMGGLYTYASPSATEGTAAGQVSAKMLRNLFRVEKFTKAAKVYGVIADPVRHSISPAVHNRAFQSKRIDSVYLPFLVHPPQLKDFFLFASKMPIAGFSVTIPHKQKILRYLDIVDPLARRIGAVNTVFRKNGKWRGLNTDIQGIIGPLSKKIRLGKSSVLVVGNGGAARGAAFALADSGAKVAIVGRNADRVRALAKACNAEALMRDQLNSRYFDAVIHATPLGMYPHVNECFFDDRIPGEIVFDMVYNPRETMLLKLAGEQNKVIIDGLQMFLEQAALQFETWTGESAPRAAMEKAALEALGVG
ncbi:MAG: shikimate dehydrogenase [Bryobacteraceae bacterium]